MRIAFQALCLIVFTLLASRVDAQRTFALDTRVSRGQGVLSRDLETARATRATFLGTTQDGLAVLRFPRQLDESIILQRVGQVEGVRSAESYEGEPYDEITELIAIVQPDTNLDGAETLAGVRIKRRIADTNYYVLESPDGFSFLELSLIAAHDSIIYANPNYRFRLARTPSEWHVQTQDRQWGMKKIGAPSAWDRVTESNRIVAVLDTGVMYDHEDLHANVWTNAREIADNKCDDDRNGYIDDVRGYDFFSNDADPMDQIGHGTHCAGIIGAMGNTGTVGVAGVCWKVTLMPVRIFNLGNEDIGADKVAEAIRYAVKNGASVINCSWGTYNYEVAVALEIQHAEQQGVLVVCAAGNGGSDEVGDNNDNPGYSYYPASYELPNIISVMSIDECDVIPRSSNYGLTSVDLAAPGANIFSTSTMGLSYINMSGTSMATAHVSGAAALAWDHPSFESRGYDAVREALLKFGRGVPALTNKCATGKSLNIAFLSQNNFQIEPPRSPVTEE